MEDRTGDALPPRLIGLALLVSAFWITVLWNTMASDLNAVWFAAHFLAAGDPGRVYVADAALFPRISDPEWLALSQAQGCERSCAFPYVYPPLWAALTAPLTGLLSAQAFSNAFLCVNIPAYFLSALLAWRLWRPSLTPLRFLVIVGVFGAHTIIVVGAFWNNQPQFLVTFLMLLAFERAAAGRQGAAGLALGLAAGVKIYPILLAVLFLRDGHWRAALVAVLTSAGLAGASLALAGADLHLAFLAQLRDLTALPLPVPWNISLPSVAATLEIGPMPPPRPLGTVAPVLATLSPVLLVAGLALLGWRSRCGTPLWRVRTLLPALICLLVLTLPLGWTYYLIIPMFALPLLADLWTSRLPVIAAIAFGAAMLAPFGVAVLTMEQATYAVSGLGAAFALTCFFLFALAPAPRDPALRMGGG